MSRVIFTILVILLVAIGTTGAYYAVAAGRRRAMLEHTPAPALAVGDDLALAPKVRQYYRLSQRAVRALEDILRQDEAIPFLDTETRRRIERIVDEFYDI